MRYYEDRTVWEAGLERIRYLFDEFENIIADCSGGKDSTVIVNLCLQVAEEKGRLPLPVYFIDQEAEWQATIDYIRLIMSDPRVDPIWMQVPIKLFNATSPLEPWLYCWDETKEDLWMRPKEPTSRHENVYGTDRFHDLFWKSMLHDYPDKSVCHIAGVRAEESPGRALGLTCYQTYKVVTYGKIDNRSLGHYTFYPLYDWSYTDIWKAIHDNGWPYCKVYDYMYQYGVPVQNMRVSNVHHETALHSLKILQEVEPDTWDKLTRRLGGINTMAHMGETFSGPSKLPPMFKDWIEYRDYLVDNLIVDPDIRKKFRHMFDGMMERYHPDIHARLISAQIASVMVNDYHGTKLQQFAAAFGQYARTTNHPNKVGKDGSEGRSKNKLNTMYDDIDAAEAAGRIESTSA